MKILERSSLFLAALMAAGGACSSSNGGSAGTGGRGSGGRSGTGGTIVTTSTGGRSGSGGSPAGGSGTGGSAAGGAAGSPSDAGAGAAPSFAYTFDNSSLGFSLNTFMPSPPQVNLAAPDAGSSPMLAFDNSDGDPNPGSLRATVTFTDYRQYIDAIVGPRPSLDLTGKTIHARVKLVSGTFNGGAILHVSSTANYLYAGSAFTTLTQGTWTEVTLNLANITTANWDSKDIRQVGIQLQTSDPPEAGTFGAPVDVVFQIDTITDGSGPITSADVPVAYNFDTGNQGFGYNTFVPTAPNVNLAVTEAGAPATLEWDSAEGNPSPGSLKASMTFTDYQQSVDVVIGPFPPLNLTGKTLHAKVRLTSGSFPNGSGVALHASTGTGFVFGGGAYTPLTIGTWTDLTLDLAGVTATNWDPTTVVQIGIQISSGGVQEAGAYQGPNPVVIHIDSITN